MNKNVFTWHRWIPVIVLLMMGTGIFAQPRSGYRNDSAFNTMRDRYGRSGLDLTDEQQESINALRETNQQEMTAIRNDLAIKRAELQKLRSAEAVDRNEVNRKLDEIGQLTTEISKKTFALEQDILNLLTEEQRSVYRSRPGRMSDRAPGWNPYMAPGWRGGQAQPYRDSRIQPYRDSRMRMNPGRR